MDHPTLRPWRTRVECCPGIKCNFIAKGQYNYAVKIFVVPIALMTHSRVSNNNGSSHNPSMKNAGRVLPRNTTNSTTLLPRFFFFFFSFVFFSLLLLRFLFTSSSVSSSFLFFSFFSVFFSCLLLLLQLLFSSPSSFLFFFFRFFFCFVFFSLLLLLRLVILPFYTPTFAAARCPSTGSRWWHHDAGARPQTARCRACASAGRWPCRGCSRRSVRWPRGWGTAAAGRGRRQWTTYHKVLFWDLFFLVSLSMTFHYTWKI